MSYYSWSGWPDSNRRPPDPQSGALPDCATSRYPPPFAGRSRWPAAGTPVQRPAVRRCRSASGACAPMRSPSGRPLRRDRAWLGALPTLRRRARAWRLHDIASSLGLLEEGRRADAHLTAVEHLENRPQPLLDLPETLAELLSEQLLDERRGALRLASLVFQTPPGAGQRQPLGEQQMLDLQHLLEIRPAVDALSPRRTPAYPAQEIPFPTTAR